MVFVLGPAKIRLSTPPSAASSPSPPTHKDLSQLRMALLWGPVTGGVREVVDAVVLLVFLALLLLDRCCRRLALALRTPSFSSSFKRRFALSGPAPGSYEANACGGRDRSPRPPGWRIAVRVQGLGGGGTKGSGRRALPPPPPSSPRHCDDRPSVGAGLGGLTVNRPPQGQIRETKEREPVKREAFPQNVSQCNLCTNSL
jgi:hypothetical protein